MAEIIRINSNTWRIEDNGVRFFVLEGTDASLMIDSGMNTPDARKIAESVTSKPLKLLNTHADRDHISGNDAFDEFYMSSADEKLLPAAHGKVIPVREGDVIDLGGRRLSIIDLPGHTPGSVAVLDAQARTLYGGDSIQDGRIFMFGEKRNFDAYIQSLETLWQNHREKFDCVYPSHGTIPVSPDLIPKLIGAAKEIVSEAAAGHEIEFMGKPIWVCDFGFASFLCDSKSV